MRWLRRTERVEPHKGIEGRARRWSAFFMQEEAAYLSVSDAMDWALLIFKHESREKHNQIDRIGDSHSPDFGGPTIYCTDSQHLG